MKIKDLKLTPPSKEAMKFFKKFMCEHDKGLKAIKTLEEIREIIIKAQEENGLINISTILQKINEVIDEKKHK